MHNRRVDAHHVLLSEWRERDRERRVTRPDSERDRPAESDGCSDVGQVEHDRMDDAANHHDPPRHPAPQQPPEADRWPSRPGRHDDERTELADRDFGGAGKWELEGAVREHRVEQQRVRAACDELEQHLDRDPPDRRMGQARPRSRNDPGDHEPDAGEQRREQDSLEHRRADPHGPRPVRSFGLGGRLGPHRSIVNRSRIRR